MSAIFGWIETNASAVESTPTNLNFGSIDQVDLTPSTSSVLAGSNSFEKYVLGDFSGSFTSISDIRFYMSVGIISAVETLLVSAVTSGYSQPSFSDPVTTVSTQAVNAMPIADPGSANVGIGGSLGGSLSAPGRTDLIVSQLQIDAGSEAGALSNKTFTLQWLEV